MKIKGMLDQILDHTKNSFLAVSPPSLGGVLICDYEKEVTLMPLDDLNNTKKSLLGDFIVKLIREGRITEYVICVEVWMAKKNAMNDYDGRPVSEDPDKEEALMVQYCNASETIHCFSKIKREEETDAVTLGEWNREEVKRVGQVPSLSTRMGDLFTRALSINN